MLTIVLAGLSVGSIYALIAVGFNVIFKSSGAINFTQGEWVMMGGMIAALAVQSDHSPVWLACLVAAVAVAAIGYASERAIIRPIRHRSALSITLVSIGLAIASKSIVMLTLGKNPQGYGGISGDALLSVAGTNMPVQYLWIFAITAVLMVGAHYFFERTRLGTAMRAAAADPEAASLVGISNNRVMATSFVMAALFGGLAGAIITPLTFISFDAGTMLGFKGFAAAMLGGIGNLYGALIGGLLLGLLEALAGGYVTSQFRDAVSFIILLAVLVARPHGLIGTPDITKV